MHPQHPKQEEYDESSPPECNELDYLEIPTQAGDMRYSQENNTSTLTLDPPQVPQQPNILNLFPQPHHINTTASYPHDTGSYYSHNPQVYGNIDVRRGLTSNPTTSTGMAQTHTHRPAALPHPGQHISTREQYATATPSFRRAAEHPTRSPPFPGPGLRRHPISPTPTSLAGFINPIGRMDTNHYANRPANTNTPPLSPVETLGTLQYTENPGTPMKVDISGSIDKGFFQSDGEWTCYRRNYFNCICSYTLNPYYPTMPIQFTPSDSNHPGQPLPVYGFSMCISAVVADNDQHKIELIQHTPKRDKGPVAPPERIPLSPKQGSGPHHPLGMYSESSGVGATRGMFADSFVNPHGGGQPVPTEHTFERIQFKQATQNNGKRRAAQQYYHLLVELWADTGPQSPEQFVRVAIRKSAKMIVRGRSPGHYQNDRRSSHSSGPGGSAGPLGGYTGLGGMADFGQGSMLGAGGGSYAGGYDARGPMYGVRQHDIPAESAVPAEDEKAMDEHKPYQYYPAAIYSGQPERVEMYSHRPGPDAHGVLHMSNGMEIGGHLKTDPDEPSRYYHTPSLVADRRPCGSFEGKTNSNGYYPTVLSSSSSGLNITMT